MFILEQKVLHIIKEPITKNCTHQTYRWKQVAMCEEKEPLNILVRQSFGNVETRIIQNAQQPTTSE